MLIKARMFSRILGCVYILSWLMTYGNTISFAEVPVIQVTPHLKEIKFKTLEISTPVLSPDNKKIAFINIVNRKAATPGASFPYPAEGNLWIFNVEMDQVKKISDKIIVDNEPLISWSPDSNSIAFGSKGEIWIVDIKNKKDFTIKKPDKDRVRTYPGYYEDYFHSPAWSPNGEIIAVRNIYDIWLYDVKSKTYKMLYSPPEELRPGSEIIFLPMVVWSNDSQKIAFDQHLRLILPSGKTKKRYIEGIAEVEIKNKKVYSIVGIDEHHEYFPVFSPDNNFLAFFSRKDWNSKPIIFINDLRINRSIKIAECEDEGHMLSWSEDRSKLYFGTKKALWVVNVKDVIKPITEKKILVKGISDLSDIFWFPKGDTLYFLKPIKAGKYSFGILNFSSTNK